LERCVNYMRSERISQHRDHAKRRNGYGYAASCKRYKQWCEWRDPRIGRLQADNLESAICRHSHQVAAVILRAY
jgi:hypothetical protein